MWSGVVRLRGNCFNKTDETNGQIWKHMENIRLHLLALPKDSHVTGNGMRYEPL